jgi:hypothetical protein
LINMRLWGSTCIKKKETEKSILCYNRIIQ